MAWVDAGAHVDEVLVKNRWTRFDQSGDMTVKWLSKLFGGEARKPSVETIYADMWARLTDDAAQNASDPFSALFATAPAVDSIEGGHGEFGRAISNPIPVNGVLGEVTYLSRLRTMEGVPFIGHRLGSVDRIDAYELMSVDGAIWDLLFLDMYHPRKSRLIPTGVSRATDAELRDAPFILVTSSTVASFPEGTTEALTGTLQRFGIPTKPSLVAQAVRAASSRPAEHTLRLEALRRGLWSTNEDQGDDEARSTSSAQVGLGDLFDVGQAVSPDATQDVGWYRNAANQGDADAQFHLGLFYDWGEGVPQDYAEAARCYRKAADQGHAEAQTTLGFMNFTGKGVPQDYAEAARWYRKAADQGDADAQTMLGNLYASGQGVPQDYAEAARWYRRAADQGEAIAQFELGGLYESGLGVGRDAAEAARWYRKAEEQRESDT